IAIAARIPVALAALVVLAIQAVGGLAVVVEELAAVADLVVVEELAAAVAVVAMNPAEGAAYKCQFAADILKEQRTEVGIPTTSGCSIQMAALLPAAYSFMMVFV